MEEVKDEILTEEQKAALEEKNLEKEIEEITKNVSPDFNAGQVAEAEAQVILDYKIYESVKFGKIKIKFPNLAQDAEIKKYYASIFNDLLMNSKLPTVNKLMFILEEKGIWTSEDEKRMEDLREWYINRTIMIEQIKLKGKKVKTDKENIESLLKERDDFYRELIQKMITRTTLFENTIEKRAEEAMFKFKMVLCCFDRDEKQIWSSVDDLNTGDANTEFEQLMVECINFWRGVPIPLSVKSL